MNIDKMQAGRELDVLVAEKVMKCQPCDEWKTFHTGELVSNCEHECYPRNDPCNYSTDIAAAWQVVTKIKELHNICLALEDFQFDGKHWQALFKGEFDESTNKWTRLDYGFADTAPLAICKAALKVVTK